MKWTELSRSRVVCPCGHGMVLTIREADEERRIRKRSRLECDVCKRRDHILWSANLLHQQQRRERLQELHDQIQTIFDEKYHNDWISHFALCRSKRAVWEILREASIIRKGLSAFYVELRSVPLPYYLNKLPNPDNIHMILMLLEIDDHTLLELLREKYELEMEIL